MAGDIGLAAVQRAHDFTHGQLAGLQHLQYAETHGLAQQTEALGNELSHGAGENGLWCSFHI
jgi:hypothetical protein